MGLRWIARFLGWSIILLSLHVWPADPMKTVQILREFCSTNQSAEWRVHQGPYTGAEDPSFDDSSWSQRNLNSLVGFTPPFWLRKTIVVPEHIAGVPLDGKGAQLRIDCLGNMRIYVDGNPIQSLEPGTSTVPLTDRAYPGREIVVAIQVTRQTGPRVFRSVDFLLSELSELRRTANDLLLDLEQALLLLRLTSGDEESSWRREFSRAIDLFDTEALYARDEAGLAVSVERTKRAVAVLRSLAKEMNVFATGRSVLDPYGECTEEELIDAAESSTREVLDLLNRFPNLVICRSEAMAHRWVEERDPELHRAVVKRVNEHRYVFVGGSWSDFDPELVGEESIIRQYLLGQRYFHEVFGQRVWVATFPGVPSVGSTIPEFLTGCGMMGVVLDPVAGPFPWNLFLWEAPSGARLLAYRAPAPIPTVDPEWSILTNLEAVYNRHKMRDIGVLFEVTSKEQGATEGLISRLEDANNRALFPSLVFTDLEDFIDRMASDPYGVSYPSFSGRITLAQHPGRLASVPEIKRLVCQAESRLEDLEKVHCILSQLAGTPYPAADLDELWRRLMIHQRPAILGGSADAHVLAQTRQDLRHLCEQLLNRSKSTLLDLAREIDTQDMPHAVLVFNPLGWVRDGAISVSSPFSGAAAHVENHWGETVPSQPVEDGSQICFLAENVPPFGFKVFRLVSGTSNAPPTSLTVTGTSVVTGGYRFSIDPKTGDMNSLKTTDVETDLFLPGGGLRIEPDRVEPQTEPGGIVNVQVTETGPVRATIRVEKQWNASAVVQEIQAVAGRPCIDIHFTVRNQSDSEDFTLNMTTALFAPTFVTAIAGGVEEKKTVTGLKINGPFPGHGWATLSTAGNTRGIALLHDGRSSLFYGPHEIKIAFRPGETPMEFNASLYAYQGEWKKAHPHRRWAELCHPLLAVQTDNHPGRLPSMYSAIQVFPDNVMLGSVRSAEATGGLLIRLWETTGKTSRAEITLGSAILSAEELTLLEDAPLPLEYVGKTTYVPIGPFQIKTVRILN
ncbi:MAG: glycosyl hydrolase-related protein [bacterium]